MAFCYSEFPPPPQSESPPHKNAYTWWGIGHVKTLSRSPSKKSLIWEEGGWSTGLTRYWSIRDRGGGADPSGAAAGVGPGPYGGEVRVMGCGSLMGVPREIGE